MNMTAVIYQHVSELEKHRRKPAYEDRSRLIARRPKRDVNPSRAYSPHNVTSGSDDGHPNEVDSDKDAEGRPLPSRIVVAMSWIMAVPERDAERVPEEYAKR